MDLGRFSRRFRFLTLLRASLVVGALYDLLFAFLMVLAPGLVASRLDLPLPGESFYLWLLAVLLTMVAAVYEVRREQTPAFLTDALARAVPALLGLTHGDGGLGNWQGAGAVDPATVEAVIRASRVRARPLRQANGWGYQRLAAGTTVVELEEAPDG